ncbi:MAG TPA: hypothetical protein VGN12_20750 [Pirellulales bacterium]
MATVGLNVKEWDVRRWVAIESLRSNKPPAKLPESFHIMIAGLLAHAFFSAFREEAFDFGTLNHRSRSEFALGDDATNLAHHLAALPIAHVAIF